MTNPPDEHHVDESDAAEWVEAAVRPTDPVDEASLESFPASDPPAFTPLHVGEPADHPDDRDRGEAGTAGA